MKLHPALPMTGLIVATITLSAVARPDKPHQKNDTQLTSQKIRGKAIIDDGIRELEIKPAAIEAIKKEVRTKGVFDLKAFPLSDGSTVDLELKESNPIKPGAQIVYQSSTDPASARVEPLLMPSDAIFLTGRVKGEEHSFAMLALSDKGSSGIIQYSKGTSIISSGKPGEQDIPVVYDPSKALGGILQMGEWSCGSDPGDKVYELPSAEQLHDHAHSGGLAAGGICTVLDLALEYDFEMWNNSLNADDWAALFYTIALMASIDEIYRRDTGIGINLSNIRIWTAANDPWNQPNAQAQLNQLQTWFPANGGPVDRDAVMLCSGRNLGGGWAFIGGLCNNFGYGVSGNMTGGFPYPLTEFHPANWDINVVAHELAHIMGSVHTRDFCPQPLTQCAPFALWGQCQTQQICGQGTIMSACQLCPGNMTNIQMRFHPAIVQLITTNVANSACIGTQESGITASNDSADTLMNTQVYIDALVNDKGVCTLADFSSFDGSSAQGGSIALSVGTGPFGRDQLRYRPATGFIGEDSFSYVATNGFGDTDGATVTIDVMPQVDMQDLLVIDPTKNIVQRFNWDTGEFLGTLVPPSEGGMDWAYAASDGPNDQLLVASFKNDYALRYDPMSGVAAGVLAGGNIIHETNDVVYDGENAYVSGRGSQNVVAYDANGNVVATYAIGAQPNDIRSEPNRDRVLVAWGSNGTSGGVQYWSTTSHQLFDSFATPQLNYAASVCRLADGDLLVGDTSGMQIARYDGASYAFMGFFLTSTNAGNSNIGSPKRIELGPDENVYVTSTTGLHRFAPDGSYLGVLESTDDPLLNSPHGLYFRVGERVPGDINNDGLVDGRDLSFLLGNWNGSGDADLNGDSVVDGIDLAILLGNWG